MLKKLKSNIDYGMFFASSKSSGCGFNTRSKLCETNMYALSKRRDLLVEGLCALGWHVEKPKSNDVCLGTIA